MDRFWRMLATTQGNLLNAEQFARSMDLSRTTINRYLHFLEAAFMVRTLQPWFGNINKRLTKSPKIYIRDSGLLDSLLGLHTQDALINHIHLGLSWEGFVIAEISNVLNENTKPWFYRTHHGAEADMVLERNGKVPAALGIKHSTSPKVSKGFCIAMEDMKTSRGYLIGNGPDTYKADDAVTVTNLVKFTEEILPNP